MDKTVTDTAVRYVLEHINDRPRTRVAQAAGISMTTLYRIIRKHGGDMRYDLSTRNGCVIELVKQYYRDMSAMEIAEKFGVSKGRVNKWARRLGLRHSPDTEARIKEKSRLSAISARDKIDYAAAARKAKAKRRLDEMRVWEGRPQKTRFRLRCIPTKTYKAKWYLINRYGYFDFPDEPCTLYHDDETRRTDREKYFTDRYHLTFKEAEQ